MDWWLLSWLRVRGGLTRGICDRVKAVQLRDRKNEMLFAILKIDWDFWIVGRERKKVGYR
jgi:hypothetical protein